MYYSFLLYVLSYLLYSGSCYRNKAPLPLSINISTDGLVQELHSEFMFSCSVPNISQSNNITLLIDNTANGDKMDRVNATPIDNGMHYGFNITQTTDNGTRFACMVNNGTDRISSETITLQVNYAPIFSVTNNVTIYRFIKTGLDSHVDCSVALANPPVTNFTVTNDSKAFSNVHFNSSSGIITFTKAETGNRGRYTCTASNSVGTTFLTYHAFIGGAPDDVNVTVYDLFNNGTYSVELGLTDNSDAPAQSITVGLAGISEGGIDLVTQGYDLPLHDEYTPTILDIPLDSVYNAEYQLFVNATNDLGSATIYSDLVSMEGTKSLDIVLEPAQPNITIGKNYTFNCTIPSLHPTHTDHPPKFNFELIINGSKKADKRLIVGKSVANYYQSYTLINTTHFDDGTVLTCLVNEVYHSDPLTMDVIFPPMFSPDKEVQLKYMNTNTTFSFQCTVLYSNPNVSSLTVSTTTSTDTTNIKIKIGSKDSLPIAVFNVSNARVSNRGVYTCNATNDVGSSLMSYKMFIGGVPDNVTVKVMNHVVNGTITISLGLTDHSDAPAQMFSVALENVGSYDIHLPVSEIPIIHINKTALELEQTDLLAGEYSIRVSGTNEIGTNYELYSDTLYLEGTAPLGVYFDSSQAHTIEGKPFAFSCSVNSYNVTMKHFSFDVLIDGTTNSAKHSRLKPTVFNADSQNYTFVNSTYLDDGTVFTCRVNGYYKSDDNNMTVYYAPVIDDIPETLGNFPNRSFELNVSISHSNPPNYTLKWLVDGKPINHSNSDAIIDKNSIRFKKLSERDQGQYTVIADNGIQDNRILHNRKSFELVAFDGPYFKEGASNGSAVLAENLVNSNFNLTCTIDHAHPPVTNLTILPDTGPNWTLIPINSTKVTLMFTKGSPENNTRKFMCRAQNNLTVATLTYDNHMGDVPKNMEVHVNKTDNGSAVVLSLEVSDNNAAKATELKYYIEGLDQYNTTVTLHPYTNEYSSIVLDRDLVMSYDDLGGSGATNHLIVNAFNLIGKAQVKNYSFSLPAAQAPKPSKLQDVAIGVGVGVLVVIIIIAIVIGVMCYRKKKKSRRGYTVLEPDDDGVGGRGSINQTSIYDTT